MLLLGGALPGGDACAIIALFMLGGSAHGAAQRRVAIRWRILKARYDGARPGRAVQTQSFQAPWHKAASTARYGQFALLRQDGVGLTWRRLRALDDDKAFAGMALLEGPVGPHNSSAA